MSVRVGSLGLGGEQVSFWSCCCLAVTQLFTGKISGHVLPPLPASPHLQAQETQGSQSQGLSALLDCRLPEDRGVGVTSGLVQGSSSLAASLTLSFPAHSQGSSEGLEQATGHPFPRVSAKSRPRGTFSWVSGG